MGKKLWLGENLSLHYCDTELGTDNWNRILLGIKSPLTVPDILEATDFSADMAKSKNHTDT